MRKIRRFLGFILKLALVLLLIGAGVWVYRNYTALKAVYAYEEAIAQQTQAHDISEYQSLAMSIMLTESKGQGNDPMQSSESVYGKQNQFDTPEQSIEQGVSYLAELIEKAEQMNCDFWTAVQAYNFGIDYIDYVAARGGVNTLELAETYSREVLSPLLGNDTEQTYRYWGIQSVFYNGGHLYHNGGNLFYADLIKMNQWKINVTARFFS
ncbi:lysozyme family protein [Enterococcus casseliflavus]|uniref:lysozyme family protein n=1 Tax=Enterococcus casseliflavus TaxID=37734 RepID=UPI003D6A245C